VRLYEYEGSTLFAGEGISVPGSRVAESVADAQHAAEEIGLPVVVKAQVLTGGRGLAGGIKTVDSLTEVAEVTENLLGSTIRGSLVGKVMVAQKVDVAREFYLGITVDGYGGVPRAILSAEGGVSIEELAKTHPEKIVSMPVSIRDGLRQFEARKMAKDAGFDGSEMLQIAGILHTLYRAFRKYDATLAEINPLARTSDEAYMAIDAKVEEAAK
jgi:succinyl-CoA synthetase beta subunit